MHIILQVSIDCFMDTEHNDVFFEDPEPPQPPLIAQNQASTLDEDRFVVYLCAACSLLC